MNRKTFTTLALGFLLLGAGCNLFDKNRVPFQQIENLKTISVGNESLRVEVADTDEERSQGLSGLDSLPESQGMLFDFRDSADRRPSFWMKGMKFDIDIIWIKDNKVVGLTKNLQPPLTNDYLPSYRAPEEIDYVLEVNAGWTDKTNTQPGTPVGL